MASRLLLVALGTLVGLGLCEGTLRLLDEPGFETAWQTGSSMHRADPELIYSLRPDAHYRWETEHFVEDASTNSLGLRGAEPRAAARRVLVLGDSMTFGHGVGDAETYPYFLEQRLRAGGEDVAVLNGGVKGYGLDQSYRRFRRRLRKLAPDLVVLAVNGNDFWDGMKRPLFLLEEDRLVPREGSRDELYRSFVLQRAVPPWLANSRTAAAITRGLVSLTAASRPEFEDYDERLRWSGRKAELLIRDLAALVRADGGAFVLVKLPVHSAPRDPYAWLPSFGDELPLLDLQADPSWQAGRDELFLRGDPYFHFSVTGNARVAAELARFLTR